MNVSKQLATTVADDTVSMYLSFEDTMSPAKCETIDSEDDSDKEDSKGNTTLEPQKDDDSDSASSEITAALAPLRLQPKILHDFKSSTPSKNDDHNYGEHIMGLADSESKRKANLSGIFENLVTKYEQKPIKDKESDKENNPISSTDDAMPSFSSTTLLNIQKANAKNSAPVRMKKQRPKTEKTTSNIIEKSSSHKYVNKKVKMHTVVRKSLCEPNSIVKKSSPYSYLETDDALNAANCEWAVFDNFGEGKYLGTINEHVVPSTDGATVEEVTSVENTNVFESSRNAMKTKKAANIARKSFIPNIPGEIGGFRMPNVVKTTFNSSTRKVPRKSYAAAAANNNALVSKRRSTATLHNKLDSPASTLRQKRYSRFSTASSSDVCIPKSRVAGGGIVTERRSPTYIPATGRKTMYNAKPESVYHCAECGASFNVKCLLDAHKHSHKRSIASPDEQRNTISSNSTYSHQCKYCDKGFAIERALHIHLLEYCPKIPASERRKLDFKEMDHVAKAATPHFHLGQSTSQKKHDKDPLMNLPVRKVSNYRDELVKNSNKDESAKNDTQSSSTSENISGGSSQMAPPPTTKIKKKTAHAGVNRTPNKEIPCLSCKQSFKNVIDYTNHMMTAHKSPSSVKNQSQ